MSLLLHNLRSDVAGCTTQSVSQLIFNLLCESKINQSDMSFSVYQYILWLQVSVDDLTLVE